MAHAHFTVTRVDWPQPLYAATFYCDRASHMVPSGFADSPMQAVQRLVHVLRDQKNPEWAQRVLDAEDQVENHFRRHPEADDVEFSVQPVQ